MLVLSRLRDEAVIIRVGGQELKLLVVDVDGKRVRLGFEAPAAFTIHRQEVQEAIDKGSDIVEGRR